MIINYQVGAVYIEISIHPSYLPNIIAFSCLVFKKIVFVKSLARFQLWLQKNVSDLKPVDKPFFKQNYSSNSIERKKVRLFRINWIEDLLAHNPKKMSDLEPADKSSLKPNCLSSSILAKKRVVALPFANKLGRRLIGLLPEKSFWSETSK